VMGVGHVISSRRRCCTASDPLGLTMTTAVSDANERSRIG
jgi:hypothetical protein